MLFKGTVEGGGTYEAGTEVTLTALPAEGYHFEEWSDHSTENPRTVTVTADATYTAVFAPDPTEGISESSAAPFRLYPNPAGECVTVETRCTASQPQEVQIVDLQGRVVLREEITTAHSTLNTSHLTAGTYFVRLGTATQRLVVK